MKQMTRIEMYLSRAIAKRQIITLKDKDRNDIRVQVINRYLDSKLDNSSIHEFNFCGLIIIYLYSPIFYKVENYHLNNVDFSHCTLVNLQLNNMNLSGCNFEHSELVDWECINTNLTNCNFQNTRFEDCNFTDSYYIKNSKRVAFNMSSF